MRAKRWVIDYCLDNYSRCITKALEEEGHMHEDSDVNKDYVYSYFQGLGYGIKEYDEKCHWLLIVTKLLQE